MRPPHRPRPEVDVEVVHCRSLRPSPPGPSPGEPGDEPGHERFPPAYDDHRPHTGPHPEGAHDRRLAGVLHKRLCRARAVDGWVRRAVGNLRRTAFRKLSGILAEMCTVTALVGHAIHGIYEADRVVVLGLASCDARSGDHAVLGEDSTEVTLVGLCKPAHREPRDRK